MILEKPLKRGTVLHLLQELFLNMCQAILCSFPGGVNCRFKGL